MGTCTCTCTCTCACGSHGPPATPPTACATLLVHACATLLVHACATLLLTFLLPPIGLTLPLSWWLARPLKAGSTGVGVLCDVFKGERSAADGTGHARPRTPGHRERQASRARGGAGPQHAAWVHSRAGATLQFTVHHASSSLEAPHADFLRHGPPPAYARGQRAVGGAEPWPQVHPGVVRGARAAAGL